MSRRPGRRPASRTGRLDVFGVVMLLVAGVMVFFAVQAVGPEIRAARGEGTPGTFTALDYECSRRSCYWNGSFRAQDGRVTKTDAWLYGRNADDLAVGDQIPALDTGNDNKVYERGTNDLIGLIGGFVMAVIFGGLGLATIQAARSTRVGDGRRRKGR